MALLSKLYLTPLRFFNSPALLLYALPWLMALLTLGTVAQRYIGLYAAQKLFFGSFILWAGLIPLPGAYSILSLIGLGLLAKLLYKPSLTKRRLGTFVVHVSILLLLLGGLLSALGREDGYMVLSNGDSSASVLDYQSMALHVKRDQVELAVFAVGKAQTNNLMSTGALPFHIWLLRYCYPCASRARREPAGKRQGLAAKIDLVTVPAKPDESRNLHGAEFEISGAGAADGIYIAFDGLALPESFTTRQASYSITLRAAERALPFSLRLVNFTKSDYPGTEEARSYRSDVMVRDGALAWNAAIEMNSPLRYKGYTLYQSSFIANENGSLQSVLTVVKNSGEWFPYVSITLLCSGLLLHMIIQLKSKTPHKHDYRPNILSPVTKQI